MNTDKNKNDIIVCEIEDFVSNEEIQEILNIADKNFKEMTTLGKQIPGFRVADGTWISNKECDAVIAIRNKISKIINVPEDNFEKLHIVKYKAGGEYKAHHDSFHENTDYYKKETTRGGQRVYSALMYLNDDFEGGETDFPKIGYKAIPKKNKLLVWKNVNEKNEVEKASLHAGLPVTSGIKYIAIFWIRENKFI